MTKKAEINYLEIFTETKRLLLEKGWTKGNFAEDENGYACKPQEAACFCLAGAMHVAGTPTLDSWLAQNLHGKAGMFAINRLAQYYRNYESWYKSPGLVVFNDATETTLEDIIGLLDFAILMETKLKEKELQS